MVCHVTMTKRPKLLESRRQLNSLSLVQFLFRIIEDSSHQGHRDLGEEVVEGGPLLLPGPHGHAPGQAPHLLHHGGVEPPRRVRITEDAASTPTLPSARSENSL